MTDRPYPAPLSETAAGELALGRFNAEFENRETEKEFRRSFAPEWRRINLVGIIVLAGFMALVQFSDIFRHPWSGDLALMLAVRVVVIATAIGAGVLIWLSQGSRDSDWAVFAFLAVYLIGFIINTWHRPIPSGQEDPLTYQVLGVALMVSAYLFFNMRFLLSLAGGIAATLAYDAAAFLNPGLPEPDTVIAFALQIVGNMLLAFTIYRVHALRRRQYANFHAERAARLALAEREFDLVAASRDLKKARDQALEATEAKSDFLAQMSHELRSPMNAIIGFTEAIQMRTLGPADFGPYSAYVDDINTSARHLLDVINDLLDLSRVEAGRFELDEEIFPVAEAADTALRMVRERATEKHIELAIAALPDDLMLKADARVVRQVLINLLTNAVKFTPEGGLVSLSSIVSGDGALTLAVADTGPGIATEDLPRVMELYGRADRTRLLRAEGTGLGLPLAKMMMELHDGSLTIESEVGRGTVTAMVFPATRVTTRKAA